MQLCTNTLLQSVNIEIHLSFITTYFHMYVKLQIHSCFNGSDTNSDISISRMFFTAFYRVVYNQWNCCDARINTLFISCSPDSSIFHPYFKHYVPSSVYLIQLTFLKTSLVALLRTSAMFTIMSDGDIPDRKLYTQGLNILSAPPQWTNIIAASRPRWKLKPSYIK